MTLTRILVALGTPDDREAAFEQGLALARRTGASLYVLHAIPADERFSTGALERLQRSAEIRRRADAAGVRVQTVEQQGDPAEIIELHTRTRGIDLIVMGNQPGSSWWAGRSRVAERVIRRTDVPVLLLAGDPREDAIAFRHVLVAVDLASEESGIVGAALALAAPDAEHVTVLHAVTGLEAVDAVHNHARWAVPEYRRRVIDATRQQLAERVASLPAGVGRDVHVATGSASRAIVTHAADVQADLVVVGRSGGLKPFGSTTRSVLRRHPGALLVIPDTALARTVPIEHPRAA